MGAAESVLPNGLTNQPARAKQGAASGPTTPWTWVPLLADAGQVGTAVGQPAMDRVGQRRRLPPDGARRSYLFSHAASPRRLAGGSLRRPAPA